VYDAEPRRLVEELLRVYRTEHHRRPSCFCADDAAAGDRETTPTVRDVVCGMETTAVAAGAERMLDGARYYFCSSRCAAQFDADPERYRSKENGNA
jgi:YHS domain-containing protein